MLGPARAAADTVWLAPELGSPNLKGSVNRSGGGDCKDSRTRLREQK